MSSIAAQILSELAASHSGPINDHLTLNAGAPASSSEWSAIEERDDRQRRTAGIALNPAAETIIDEDIKALLLRKFDECTVWMIAHLRDSNRIAVDDILKASWLSTPRAYMSPSPDGDGVLLALRVKIGMGRATEAGKPLPVFIMRNAAMLSASLAMTHPPASAVLFNAYPDRNGHLPHKTEVEMLIELTAELARGGIEVTELGAIANFDVITRAACEAEGVFGCCYYSIQHQQALIDLGTSRIMPEEDVVRIEVNRSKIRADYAAIYINDLISSGRDIPASGAVSSLSKLPVLLPPLHEQASISKFHNAVAAYRTMTGEALLGLDGAGLRRRLDEAPAKLFLASVRCNEIVETGTKGSVGSLPYPLGCAYRAFECASESAGRMDRAFKIADAIIEFHSLCAMSIASATFYRDAGRELAELYNKNKRLELGMWISKLESVSGRYSSFKGHGGLDELSTITAHLGVASVYALDQLFAEEIVDVFNKLREMRNNYAAHGPSLGNREKDEAVVAVMKLIHDYISATTSLWGHLRLGYCSDVKILEDGTVASMIEHCGQEKYGKTGVRFTTPTAIATPKTLVLYPSGEEQAFIPLLPFYYTNQIAPSLHIVYHLSRTAEGGGVLHFNSYAALEAGPRSREEIAATSPLISRLVEFLKKYPYTDPKTKLPKIAI